MKKQKPLSWEPALRGKIYCAPACGGGCTKAAHDLATARAKALAAGMGPGWKARVWENLGWHYSVLSPCGRWKIHPHHGEDHDRRRKTTYSAFLGDADSPGGTWAEHGDSPRAAMAAVWRVARPQIDRWWSFHTAGADVAGGTSGARK